MLGADHHGYVGRMMAMCAAFGDTPRVNLEILIGQMVNLRPDGQPVRMSKRAGTVITLEDLVEAVGVDAARYALARYSADSTIDIDLDLLGKRSNDNPVFYVQYAHARTLRTSATPLALEDGVRTEDGFDPSLLTDETESVLLRHARRVPAASSPAPPSCASRTASRATWRTLAGAYHKWYDDCRVPPAGRRGGHRPAPHPAVAQRGDPHRARPAGSTCSASRPRSGCSARPRGRCPARRRVPRPVLAAPAGRRQRAGPARCGRPTSAASRPAG